MISSAAKPSAKASSCCGDIRLIAAMSMMSNVMGWLGAGAANDDAMQAMHIQTC